jgi:hypothetical protein
MATTDSPLNIKGSIKGLRFYKREGSTKTFVGQKGGASGPVIRNSAKFEKLRLAQNELRGRSKLAKDIRLAMGNWSSTIVNRYLQTAIAGVLQQVMNMDSPEFLGKRTLYLSKFKEVLNQIKWYYYKPLNEIMLCPYSVETSEDKKAVTITIKGLNPKFHIKAPLIASHFRLCLSIATVSDYDASHPSKIYMRTTGINTDRGKDVKSDWIAINEPLMDEIVLTASLPENFVLKDNYTVVRSFGILFGQMTYQVNLIARERGSIAFLRAV